MALESFTSYGKRIKDLNNLVTQLRNTGLQAVLDIPLIAVVGNQSAGKSSLVEAICGITLPRSTGTCTRCPTEVEMSYHPEWSCTIKLRIDYDDAGAKLPVIRTLQFGKRISDKSSLENLLKIAQVVILNTAKIDDAKHVDPSDPRWTPEALKDNALEFSKNTICIAVRGPELISLSFVDLPGVIQNADRDKSHLIALVEAMVRNYTSRPSCLILSVITMSDDIENQAAPRIAREVDPDGARTIGVLTKPDLMQEDAHDQWLEIMTGRKYALYHGYYLTIQPSTKDLNKGAEFAKTLEQKHLHSGLWDQVPIDRRGVSKLTECLSHLLNDRLQKQIPELANVARIKLAAVRETLGKIPKPISDKPAMYIQGLCLDFATAVKEALIIGKDNHQFWRKWHSAEQVYVQAILEARPEFLIESRESPETSRSLSALISKGDFCLAEGLAGKSGTISLKDVKLRCEESRTVELGTHVAYRVKRELYQSCVDRWDPAVLRLLDDMEEYLEAFSLDVVRMTFSPFEANGLLRAAEVAVFEILSDKKRKILQELEIWMKAEKQFPFTLNLHDLADTTEEYYAQALELRQGSAPEGDKVPKAFGDAKYHLGILGHTISKMKDLTVLDPVDVFDREMRIMAESLAYFRIVAKRQFDVVPMLIQYHFVRGFTVDLRSKLFTSLLNGSETLEQSDAVAARFLAEDSQTTKIRQQTECEHKMLDDAVKLFRQFS